MDALSGVLMVIIQQMHDRLVFLTWGALFLIILALYPLYSDMGWYVGLGAWFSLFLLFLMARNVAKYVDFLDLISFNYFLQMFLASL